MIVDTHTRIHIKYVLDPDLRPAPDHTLCDERALPVRLKKYCSPLHTKLPPTLNISQLHLVEC